ncbi:MAG: glycosyltransferase [Acidimicrobiia bacterium]|nr:glycosyltransferase [Acidimicrobiia bacterium]
MPALVDLDDLLSDRYRAWADLPFDRLPFDVVGTNPSSPYNVVARRLRPLLPLVLRAEARSVAGIEQMIAERADRVSLVSPREAATFASRTGRIVDVLPMAAPRVPERPWAAPAAPEFDAVFLGRTTHLTNLAALDWLGREVLPRLGERLGRAPRVGVAGASSPSVDAWMTELALEPLGYVPDLQLLFAAASCAVAPQVVGGGMNTKVLDYATHGVPVVGTTHAFAGLVAGDELDGHGIDDAGVFADRIARLRADREMAQAFGGAARAHVDAYYRAPVVQARWRHAFKTAINSSEGVHA